MPERRRSEKRESHNHEFQAQRTLGIVRMLILIYRPCAARASSTALQRPACGVVLLATFPLPSGSSGLLNRCFAPSFTGASGWSLVGFPGQIQFRSGGVFCSSVSSVNIALWFLLKGHLRRRTLRLELIIFVSAVYVFGCAFRAVLPRADVQRICLFDTWLSSVALGRSIATLAEICFVIQWAIVLRYLAKAAQSDLVRMISLAILPLIIIAECCSWHAVITTNYLGNTVENSLWAATFLIIGAALLLLLPRFVGAAQIVIAAAFLGVIAYVTFMFTVDVPMYFARWQADAASGKEFFGFLSGLRDAQTRWVVAHDFAHWEGEIAWMSLYFSLAVWTSSALLRNCAGERPSGPRSRATSPLRLQSTRLFAGTE